MFYPSLVFKLHFKRNQTSAGGTCSRRTEKGEFIRPIILLEKLLIESRLIQSEMFPANGITKVSKRWN